jgi:murein DD-endopeptidase MepM/ murein hydrolase activator NlpD
MLPLDQVTLAASRSGDTAERQQIRRLAQEFEAMLLTQMLRGMRRAMLDDHEQESGLGSGTLIDTSDVELGLALSRGGGFGLTDALLDAFERQVAPRDGGGSSPAATADVAGGNYPLPPAVPEQMPLEPLRPPIDLGTHAASLMPISSTFGWRRDPVTGAGRFHTGVDIAVAYGTEVRAAAAGRVAFSGVQNGYGNTVIIDHGGSRQTRYAHLSEQSVQQGDVVTEGQVIGRAGNSGRSTGPHLHFELLVDGKPVDPMIGDE